jgi:ABC-type nickel/cobalt efflux system permease component RcnA
MISILPGFLAGLIHVVSGPDHLAAVGPLAVKGCQRAWLAGLRWGIGHALGVAMMGAGSLLLREMMPIELISSWSERLVGALLIGIGLWGFRRALRNHVHAHEHIHDGERHVHVHVHTHCHKRGETRTHVHSHAALGIGTLHGLAGGSHFLGIMPALALPSLTNAVSYVLAYGAGTIAAMSTFSTLVGLVAARCEISGGLAYRRLMSVCSCAAVAVGCAWLVL